VLQVLDPLHALGQRGLEAGERLARQRCAGLGGITLPAHRIGQVQARLLQQRAGLGRPFLGDRLLRLGALDLVELLLQRLGSTLVAVRELAVDIGHAIDRGFAGEPLAQAGGSLARGRCSEGAAGQGVELGQVGRFGRRLEGIHDANGVQESDARDKDCPG